MRGQNENAFRISDPLWVKSTGHQWISLTEGQWYGALLFFLLSALNNHASDWCFKTSCRPCDVTVMKQNEYIICCITHWGRVTDICIVEVTIIGSDNSLSPYRCQAIIWTNAGILLIGPLGTNFCVILIFHSRKCDVWEMVAILSRPQYDIHYTGICRHNH